MEVLAYKKRTQEEIQGILDDVTSGVSKYQICKKYDLSETALYRILSLIAGKPPSDYLKSIKKNKDKIKKKKKIIQEQSKQIEFLRNALKKL